MKRLFVKHPNSIGESYSKHWLIAVTVGFRMVFSGMACFIHAFFPFLFVSTASKTVQKLNSEFAERFKVLEKETSDS